MLWVDLFVVGAVAVGPVDVRSCRNRCYTTLKRDLIIVEILAGASEQFFEQLTDSGSD